jgi:hypothetical protein
MKEDIKARWLTALRDPAARQVAGRLGTVDGRRCCLGVLCDIAVEDGVIDPPGIVPRPETAPNVLTYAGNTSVLPPEVVAWAELENESPMVEGEALATMNDDGVRFPAIAAEIERVL